MIGKYVVVRTVYAGVHHGVLAEDCGECVVLTDARRVWNWSGANSLHEIALHGPAEESRITEAVPEISVRGVIEVIPCTSAAEKNLRRSRWNPGR